MKKKLLIIMALLFVLSMLYVFSLEKYTTINVFCDPPTQLIKNYHTQNCTTEFYTSYRSRIKVEYSVAHEFDCSHKMEVIQLSGKYENICVIEDVGYYSIIPFGIKLKLP